MGLFSKAKKSLKKRFKESYQIIKDVGNGDLTGVLNRSINLGAKTAFGKTDMMGYEYMLSGKYTKQIEAARLAENLKTKDSLLKALNSGNEKIDRQTAGEIRSLLQKDPATGYAAATKLFTAAKEGVDKKFIARLQSDATHDLLVDMPGAKQTRIDGFAQASMQLLGRR